MSLRFVIAGALLLSLSLVLFSDVATAARCLSSPPNLGRRQACGSALDCSWGNFCNRFGVCARRAQENEDCEYDECDFGLTCRGPTDRRRCLAPLSPGDNCDIFASGSNPPCGTNDCSDDRICIGAPLGAFCGDTSHCANNLTCVDDVCVGLPVGAACLQNSECEVDAFCLREVCAPRLTSGNCTSSIECARGYICTQDSVGTEDLRQCFAEESRVAGEFCGNNQICASLRCIDSYCAERSVRYCRFDNHCAADETCTCDGKILVEGVGECTKNPCYKLSQAYNDCVEENCKFGSGTYPGSCIDLNCKRERERSIKCSDASQLLSSLLLASLISIVGFVGANKL